MKASWTWLSKILFKTSLKKKTWNSVTFYKPYVVSWVALILSGRLQTVGIIMFYIAMRETLQFFKA